MAPRLLFPALVQQKQRVSRCAGFTLIELFVVLAIAGLVMGLGIPALHNFIVRSRTEGFARELSMLLQRTRLESIRANRNGVVQLDTDTGELVAWVDANANGTFDPDPDKPYRTADFVIGRMEPSRHVRLEDQDGIAGIKSIYGFSGGDDKRWAVFNPDGSVDTEGAFRVSDVRGNHLEVRVAPAATGRVEILKHQDGVWIGAGDPASDDFKPWKWQ